MAAHSNFWNIGTGRTYLSTKPIASQQHMAVWLRPVPSDVDPTPVWIWLPYEAFDLINNNAVISESFNLTLYDRIEVRVGDTPDELNHPPSDVDIIIDISEEIKIVAEVAEEVIIVAAIADKIEIVAEEPLRTAIVNCGTEPVMSSILDGEANAERAEDARDESMLARDFSSQWSSNPIDEDVDDGINPINKSSYHWSEVSKAYASGLQIQGSWNPNSASDPVPIGGAPVETGMFWICSENASTPVYDEDWKEYDRIIYITGQLPYPYLRISDYVEWENIINVPQDIQTFVEVIAASGNTHYDIAHNLGNISVEINGITLAKSDFTSDAIVDNVSAGFTLLATPTDGDLVTAKGAWGAIPPSSGLEELWSAQAEVLNAASYAVEPEDVLVKSYVSNNDGTFTPTNTTDYSSLHYEAKAKKQADDIKAVTVASPVASIPLLPDGETGVPTVTYDDTTGQFSYGIPVGKTGESSPSILPEGGATVAELNAFTVDPTIGSAWWMQDAGTITYGSQPTDVVINDVVVWVVDGYFFNMGPIVTGASWETITDVTVDGATSTIGDDLARRSTTYTKTEQNAIDLAQDNAIALNTSKVGYTEGAVTANPSVAANTAKVSYKDTMTFDGTTLAITIG